MSEFKNSSKRFNNLESGRYSNIHFDENFDNIFGLIENQYAGMGSFVVNGCQVNTSNPASSIISPGMVYFDTIDDDGKFDGKLCYYGGATVDLSGNNAWYLTRLDGGDDKFFTHDIVSSSADPGNVPKIIFTKDGASKILSREISTEWINIPSVNIPVGVTNGVGSQALAVRKVTQGDVILVELKGNIICSGISTGGTIFVLPEEFRPSGSNPVRISYAGFQSNYADVGSNGNVRAGAGGLSNDNISFNTRFAFN